MKHNMKNCSSVYEFLYLLDIPQEKETTTREDLYLKVHNVASIHRRSREIYQRGQYKNLGNIKKNVMFDLFLEKDK